MRPSEVVHPELLGQLPLPLVEEERRQDQLDAQVGLVQQHLADDDPSLDGLPETDLIGKEVALDRVLQDAPCGLDLVSVEFDAAR